MVERLRYLLWISISWIIIGPLVPIYFLVMTLEWLADAITKTVRIVGGPVASASEYFEDKAAAAWNRSHNAKEQDVSACWKSPAARQRTPSNPPSTSRAFPLSCLNGYNRRRFP